MLDVNWVASRSLAKSVCTVVWMSTPVSSAAGSVTVWKGEGLDCAPCYRDGVFPDCPRRECLERITPQEIFELAEKMMAEP